MDENEKKFWSDMDGIFPELVKQMASLAKKSYYSITNLKRVSHGGPRVHWNISGLNRIILPLGRKSPGKNCTRMMLRLLNTASDGALKEMTLTSHGNIVLKTETSIIASTLCRR